MPALSMFYGIIIYMYNEKGEQHHIPHIHAMYQGDEVVVSIEGDVLGGTIPNKKLKLVLAWIEIHEEDLEANWRLLSNGQEFFKIDPLR